MHRIFILLIGCILGGVVGVRFGSFWGLLSKSPDPDVTESEGTLLSHLSGIDGITNCFLQEKDHCDGSKRFRVYVVAAHGSNGSKGHEVGRTNNNDGEPESSNNPHELEDEGDLDIEEPLSRRRAPGGAGGGGGDHVPDTVDDVEEIDMDEEDEDDGLPSAPPVPTRDLVEEVAKVIGGVLEEGGYLLSPMSPSTLEEFLRSSDNNTSSSNDDEDEEIYRSILQRVLNPLSPNPPGLLPGGVVLQLRGVLSLATQHMRQSPGTHPSPPPASPSLPLPRLLKLTSPPADEAGASAGGGNVNFPVHRL
eukprot:gene41891-51135_t